MHSLRTRLQTVFEDVARLMDKSKSLQGDLNASEADNDKTKEQLARAQAELERVARELSTLRQQYGWKEKELEELKHKSSTAIEELERRLQVGERHPRPH
jgi:chromosome segregation ATPase